MTEPGRTLWRVGPWVCAFAVTVLWGSAASAVGGYYAGTKGARASGRAGAFVAKADDLSAAAINPAGFSRIEGLQLHVGNRFSYNAHSFQRAPTLDWGNVENGVPPYVEFDRVENATPWQLLDPLIGVGTDFGLRDFGFALVAYSPPGVSKQRFPVDGGQRYMMVQREAMIVNYTANVAWQYENQFGIGASLQWIAVPKLDYQIVIDANTFPGNANPVSNQLDMLATIRGDDPFTLNAIVGAWFRPTSFLELGLSGQVVPSSIQTQSTLDIDPLESEDDVVLRRGADVTNDVTLTLPLPLSARFGVRYFQTEGISELFDIELDVVYETWSRVESFTMDSDGLVGILLAQTLDVGVIEVEKQWQDTIGVQLGGDYALVPDLFTLRGGVAYETAVADPSYANVDFAGGRQLIGAVGFSILADNLEVAVAYEYRHQPAVSIREGEARVYQEVPGSACEAPYTDPNACHPQYLGQPAPAVNAGTYRAHAHVASLDFLYQF